MTIRHNFNAIQQIFKHIDTNQNNKFLKKIVKTLIQILDK